MFENGTIHLIIAIPCLILGVIMSFIVPLLGIMIVIPSLKVLGAGLGRKNI
ncbi:MAG: hypothetical protein ACOCUI_02245 [bacterium]